MKTRKNDVLCGKVGRPPKGVYARMQVVLWVIAVYRMAGSRNFGDLQDLLGEDGKWEGMWARYRRGLVAPSGKRIARIEEKVPGTARYFHTGFWDLLENRPYAWGDFFDAISTLPQGVFPQLRRDPAFGRLAKSSELESLLNRAVDLVRDSSNGIHALVVILVLLREAELVKDELLYIQAVKAWAKASERKGLHPFLAHLPESLFARVAQPLETIVFADQAKNASWQQFLAAYIAFWHNGKKPLPDEFDVLECVSRFLDFRVRSKEEIEQLVSLKRPDYQTEDSKYPSWLLPVQIRR